MDLVIFQFFNQIAHISTLLDWVIIFFGSYLPYLIAIVSAVLVFTGGGFTVWYPKFAAVALTTLLSWGVVNLFIRYFFFRMRPSEALGIDALIDANGSSSFPSGHASFFFALALAILFFVDVRWGWILFSAVCLVSIARIVAGVHWPLDIAGGLIIAIMSVIIVRALMAHVPPSLPTM